MPLNIAPLLVEQSDFNEGWTPDIEPSHVPLAALLESSNLLPGRMVVVPTVVGNMTMNRAAVVPQTRKGYKRVHANADIIGGYYIRHVFPYYSMDGGTSFRTLILILTNETN